MKNILITGASGFIGSHLTELLVFNGYNVKAFVHYNSANFLGNLENLKILGNIEIIKGDIRDYDSVFSALKNVDVVFHLAALIGIPYSYISPRAYIETNINGTYNILQASRELRLSQVLVTSTSETYGTAQYVPIDEKHPLNAQSPYAASKIGADQLALSFYRSFDLPVKVVRPFNTYGSRQSARAIIPTIITQILNGNDEVVLGNLTPTRDLTYVKDTCSGFYEIFNSDKLVGEITNIGMNSEISIGDLVKLIAETMNVNVKIIDDKKRIRPSKSEVKRLNCDNAKIKKLTNWEPKYNLNRGIEETIKYLESNLDNYKSEIYNV